MILLTFPAIAFATCGIVVTLEYRTTKREAFLRAQLSAQRQFDAAQRGETVDLHA